MGLTLGSDDIYDLYRDPVDVYLMATINHRLTDAQDSGFDHPSFFGPTPYRLLNSRDGCSHFIHLSSG